MKLFKKFLYNLKRFFTSRDIFEMENEEIDEEMQYLESLREPKNDFERSICQYYCQMKNICKLKKIMLNIFSLIFYIPLILIYVFLGNFYFATKQYDSNIAVFWNSLGIDIVPDSVKKAYKVITVDESSLGILKIKDIKLLLNCIYKTGMHPFFHFKIMLRLAYYRKIIEKYRPKCIISTAEYSFTSSTLTCFCEMYNIKHINIMHGEKLLDIRDSFFRFSLCYIWDKHYQEMFYELKAEKKQFVIEVPIALKFNNINNQNILAKDKVDYKFFLDIINEDYIKKLRECCNMFIESNCKIKIRPHPLHSDISLLLKYFCINEIEDTKKITIDESVLSSNFVIARYSTVLNQAYNSGIKIIIDNVTDPKIFNKLNNLKYIGFSYKHLLLSDVLNSLNNKQLEMEKK